MKLVIPGRPVPAVRMTNRGKFVKPHARMYLDYKQYIGWLANAQKCPRINGNIEVRLSIYLYGKNVPMGKSGDIDNYFKGITDSLNGIAWDDDRQIVKATIEKIPCKTKDEERAEIEYWEVS